QRKRVHRTLRMAARGPGAESTLSEMVQDGLSEDGTGGVAGADEQRVVRRQGHILASAASASRLGLDRRRKGLALRRATCRVRLWLHRRLLLAEHRNVAQRMELLPGNALWVGHPVLVAAGVATG